VDATLADSAVSGEAASRYGGRWNPPGFSAVYASASRALAVLESLVHLTVEARSMQFLLYELTLPRRTRMQHRSSPHEHSLAGTQEAGREWLQACEALALVVPSVIIPQETNYVLNVRHPQFARLQISDPEPFSFDERLWR
jgi:RES domain-containing protein